MFRRLGLGVLLAIFAPAFAGAQTVVSADTLSTDEAREILGLDLYERDAWYMRSFNSFFGRDEAEEEQAARGNPIRIDEAFEQYAGLRIRHVWVIRREAFGIVLVDSTEGMVEDPQELLETEASGLGGLLNSMATKTRERTVRKYLRFREGDRIDPFAFGDSERLLRQRSYINDVKIEVIVLDDEPGWADVVVLTRDRWPFGVKGKIHTANQYAFELFDRNVAGIGLGLEYEAPVDTRRDPALGHRVKVSFDNVAGSFVDVSAQVRTQWNRDEWSVEANRNPVHPDIRIVGGVKHETKADKNESRLPEDAELRVQTLDPWLGYSIRLGYDGAVEGRRVRLIPAVRYIHSDYLAPPRLFAESEQSWRDSRRYLGQLTLNGAVNYTARLVYSYGETEDVATGYWYGLTGGYEEGELRKRSYAGFRAAWSGFTEEQGLNRWLGAVGGYQHGNHFEDGVVTLSWFTFGPLRTLGSSYLRNFRLLTYTLGINRTGVGGIRLDNVALRDLDSPEVSGDHRLGADFESVVFTPYAFLGFRVAAFAYAGGGFVSGTDDALFDERFSMNLGSGLRLNNPRLVIPTAELRFGFLSTSQGTEFRVKFRMEDLRLLRRGVPSAKPETLRYE